VRVKFRRTVFAPHCGRAILVIALLVGWSAGASAESPYQLESRREWTLLGVGVALSLGGLAIMESIEPFTPPELAGLDLQDVNAFDRAGVRPYRDSRDGDALKLGSFLMPLSLLIDERSRRDWKTLGVMWGEVLLLQSGFTAMTKGLMKRTRPYAYDPNAPLEARTSTDARISFYSGHTSTTAATCFFLARVYSDYPFSRATKVAAWTVAVVYPAAVAYLRVDSGHHFRTDVITGYVVGAAIGYLVPVLHRVAKHNGLSLYQVRSGRWTYAGLSLRF